MKQMNNAGRLGIAPYRATRALQAAGCVLVAAAAFSLSAEVAVTDWSQDAATDVVTVRYTLTGEAPKVITLDVLTNGVSIGGTNLAYVTGDANKLVQPGDTIRQILWRPDRAWNFPDPVNVQMKVVEWPTNSPPDYMAITLSAGTATPENVRYYVSEDALPGGIDADRWRTDTMLMRRIHAAGRSFIMGSPLTEQYRNATLNSGGACERFGQKGDTAENGGCLPETPHRVSFSKDFYIAVFKPTYGQIDFMLENYGTGKGTGWADAAYMKMGLSWNDVRGEGTAVDGAPSESSLLGKLRTLTGVAFDLPTEAQWEYACRAGTYTPFNDGRIPPKDYRWCKDSAAFPTRDVVVNCNYPGWSGSMTKIRPGICPPNNWGLYEMNGCWGEWCLDSVDDQVFSTEPVMDPVGTSTAKGWKCHRGGVWSLWAPQSRSAARVGVYPAYAADVSFRPICPAGAIQ